MNNTQSFSKANNLRRELGAMTYHNTLNIVTQVMNNKQIVFEGKSSPGNYKTAYLVKVGSRGEDRNSHVI